MPNRKVAPPIKNPVDFKLTLPVYQKYILSNGVEVYALDMGSEDTIQISWVFYAGNWYEEKKAVSTATNYLMKNGTSTKTAFDINEHFEYYGAYLNRACYQETSEVVLSCLSKHIKELLPAVAELFTDAVFPEEEIEIYKRNAQQRLKVNLLKSEFVAGRLIDAYLFGESHPYGRSYNQEDYEAVNRDDIKAFYDKYYRNGRCAIFVAGKLPKDIVEQLEQSFGKLPLRKHTQENGQIKHIIQPATQKKYEVINDPDGVQASIRFVRPFPNRHHPDFQKALVLNNLFGGFFGSRLMANIREEKGYTYGIYSYIMNYISESGWMITTEAGRDVSKATIEEVYKEMAILREEPVDEEELQMTQNFMIGSILGDLDGPFQVIGRWKNIILNNLDESYFYNGISSIQSVTPEEIQALANKYLQPESFYELVVV